MDYLFSISEGGSLMAIDLRWPHSNKVPQPTPSTKMMSFTLKVVKVVISNGGYIQFCQQCQDIRCPYDEELINKIYSIFFPKWAGTHIESIYPELKQSNQRFLILLILIVVSSIIFCSNMDQKNPLPGRITHRLNLDSEEEQEREEQERLEREQYQRQKQEKRKRKQQKRKAKQEEERAAKQELERKLQQRKQEIQKYNDPTILFQPDSDSGISFSRLKRKIEQMYPKYSKKKVKDQSSELMESQEAENNSSSEESQSSSDSQNEEDSSPKKKQKKTKKIEKRRRNQSDSEDRNQRKKNKLSTKIEPELSAKDKLVQEVAVRWNYGLGDWPPQNYDYENQLKKKGYRVVQLSKFKFVDEVIDGLVKVYELDGYKGVYRGKFGLIDVRPKEECPSLNYFYSKSDEQLNVILKRALVKQLEELQNVEFKQSGEEKLLEDLRRRVRQLEK